jgi:hypothetical protein
MLVQVISMVMNVIKRALVTVAPVYQIENVHGVKTFYTMDHIVNIAVHPDAIMENVIKVLENV